MDQLTAYRILKIAPGSSAAEIKKAYVRLSRQYHPEEHPEEFRQIHDAYRALASGKGSARIRQHISEEQEFLVQKKPEKLEEPSQNMWKNAAREPKKENGHPIEKERDPWLDIRPKPQRKPEIRQISPVPEAQETEEEKLFTENALDTIYEEERKQRRDVKAQALQEIRLLLTGKDKKNLFALQQFFRKEEYMEIVHTEEFLQVLCELLEHVDLVPAADQYLLTYYALGTAEKQKEGLSEGKQRLYLAITQIHADLSKKAKRKNYIILGGIGGAMTSGVTLMDGAGTFKALLLAAVAAIGWYGLYRGLRSLQRIKTGLRAQRYACVLMFGAQLFLLKRTDVFDLLLGSEYAGTMFGEMTMLIFFLWYVAVLIASVFAYLWKKRKPL